MTVVSSKEFATNQDKYLDMALNEDVCIKRGQNMFYLMYRSSDKTADGINSASRHGWAESAKEFIESGNEESFFPDFFEDEDLSWWQWKQK